MRPLIIAHRGASGYLPEHTLEAKTMAHRMGADYLEQDLVATADDELVVLHDIFLDRVTDVAERFDGRERDDGRYYVRDFTLAELGELRVWERFEADGSPVFPGRYPARSGDFRIHTFEDELALVARLNAESGRRAGVYPELKKPAWHRDHGVDMAPLLQQKLLAAGYADADSPVFVQCFDGAELRRLREEFGYPWRLVQLIGEDDWGESASDFAAMRTPRGLEAVRDYADAIGPWLRQLYSRDASGTPSSAGLAEAAHAAGLAVHTYTVRDDDLPPGFDTLAALVAFLAGEIGVDGFFTDFPDTLLAAIEAAGP